MRMVVVWLCVVAGMCAGARGAEDPLLKDHMSEEIFMKAAWHMEVEGVREGPEGITVTTTGATFVFVPGEDTIRCAQRIGKEREILVVALGKGALEGLAVKAKGTGAIILESPFTSAVEDVRPVNGSGGGIRSPVRLPERISGSARATRPDDAGGHAR